MKSYIFVTSEGYTYQPNSEAIEPDVENLQVIGFASGENEEEAFQNLLKEDHRLLETSFREVFTYELKHNDFQNRCKYLYVKPETDEANK